jgi:hypothetical protein
MNYLLTQREHRKQLKLTRSTYFRWLQNGMPTIGWGQMRRFRLDDVLAWLKQYGEERTVWYNHSQDHLDRSLPTTR